MAGQYYLIDYENIQPESLPWSADESCHVLLFVGARQNAIPIGLAMDMQAMGARAQYVKVAEVGKNAADFHLAWYLGHLTARDATAEYIIVSADTGFDPLVKHLLKKGVRLKREDLLPGMMQAVVEKALPETNVLPLRPSSVKSEPAAKVFPTTLQGRLDYILEKLRSPKTTLPASEPALKNAIASLFRKQIEDADIEGLIAQMRKRKLIVSEGKKIKYSLLPVKDVGS